MNIANEIITFTVNGIYLIGMMIVEIVALTIAVPLSIHEHLMNQLKI